MTDAQGELFGEVGGLFGPDTITTTPLDELDLPREIAPGVILTPTDDDDDPDDDPAPGPGRCDECGSLADRRGLYVLGDDRAVCADCRPRETHPRHECPDCGRHYDRRAQYVTSGDHAAGRPCYSCRGTELDDDARALCYHRTHCGATETNPCTAAPRRRQTNPGALF